MAIELILGYLGIFVASMIGSASIFFPLPSFMLIPVTAIFLNPFLVGFFAAVGATIGELTGYAVGYSGNKIFLKKKYSRFEKWFEKQKVFLLIIIFAATPLPFDIIGLLCGASKYNIKKFLLATFIGKLIISILLAFMGFGAYTLIAKLIWP